MATCSPPNLARRRLLQLAGLAGGALAVDLAGLARVVPGAGAAAGSRWSDPATWGGSVPGPDDVATISTDVVLDSDASVAGVEVEPGGSLTFQPDASVTLRSTANVVILGTLVMRPRPTSHHQLVFDGVQEASFVGGGMDVVEGDVGLWVMGAGRLDLAGSAKTAWARLAGDGAAGATELQLDRSPAGWAVGDRITVVPTSPPAARSIDWHSGFSEATVTAVSGSRVNLDPPLAFDHPRVGGTWTAEVLNLTRNVEVLGAPQGRSHVFVRSTGTQMIHHVALRHLGPRRDGEKILGRWPLHIHHCMDATRGTVIEGVVVTDAGSHAFVPHMSHGLTFRDCVAYDVEEHAFWWDDGEATDDTIWESCVAAEVTTTTAISVGGFYLGRGSGNVVRDCVAVGTGGSDGAGFIAPAACCDGEWTATDCLGHNNKHAGWKTYINTDRADAKVVAHTTAYHNEFGIDHGAYKNSWRYDGFTLYGNVGAGINLRAVSNADGVIFANGLVDQAAMAPYGAVNARHFQATEYPTRFESCTFRGHTKAALGVIVPNKSVADLIDLIDCTFEGNELWIGDTIPAACEVRFQDRAHGTLSARRRDQAGALVPAWNARTQPVPDFA